MASNLHITSSEEQAEGKPSPTDLPMDTLPPPEAANEPPAISTEPQEKEKAKKTKNNKGTKLDVPQGNAMPESLPPTDGLENPGPLLNNKRNSFRQQYTKLPTNLPMRSAACSILWADGCSVRLQDNFNMWQGYDAKNIIEGPRKASISTFSIFMVTDNLQFY